jgi:hypothetical protein
MAGGLMQLVAYGAQDIYLTGNPQITFFKVVYKRHTNFAMEAQEIPLNSSPDFGKRSNVIITRVGDLVTKIYLIVKLNQVVPRDKKAKFAWVRRVGLALLDNVEIEIGGAKIDKQYGVWLNIWYELARHAGDGERGYLNMVGDVAELTEYSNEASPEYTLYIPLKFWFNRHVGLALPLIALQYHEVRLNFEFKRVEELIVSNCHFRKNDLRGVTMKDASILVDFIFLDSEERRRFAQVGHEYLIEQLQFTGTEAVTSLTGHYRLNFNHPSKEIVWGVINGNFNSGKRFINYTNKDDWFSDTFLKESAKKILSDSIRVVPVNGDTSDQYGTSSSTGCSSSSSSSSACFSDCKNPCDNKASCIESFAPGESGFTENGNVFVDNQSDGTVQINTHSLKVKCQECYNLTDLIQADVFVGSKCDIKITVTDTQLTPRDLSIPVENLLDTRFNKEDDVIVYQPFNFGVLIDGTGNPVESAIIQLNGHDRFDKREGSYFNYVQPDQHHTNTPADGINVYSFALHPEQHQPSGSANLSRIDNTLLNIWFADPTYRSGLPHLNFINQDNKLYIFDVNNNIFRVMSGMGGMAYAN